MARKAGGGSGGGSEDAMSVYLFVPNLIGYMRIILALVGFWVVFEQPGVFFICYGLSALLDIADGHAARLLGQSSRYGAVLDMVTDRAATTCLCMALSKLYPSLTHLWMLLVALDIMSHFAHLYSSLLRGVGSHKAISEDQSPLLRLYYTNRLVLGILCAANEGVFLCLYAFVMHAKLPAFLSFSVPSFLPLSAPCHQVASMMEQDLAASLPEGFCTPGNVPISFFMVALAFLGWVVKNFINFVQLLQAGSDIVAIDLKERAAAASAAKPAAAPSRAKKAAAKRSPATKKPAAAAKRASAKSPAKAKAKASPKKKAASPRSSPRASRRATTARD